MPASTYRNALCSPWLLAWGFRKHQESGREAVKHQGIPWAFPAQEPPHPWTSPHRDLPAVWPSPPYRPLQPMALPSYVSSHYMNHLTANGLLKAKAIEELCFLDSSWVLPPPIGSKCQYLKMNLLDESGHLASIYFSVVNSHPAIPVIEMYLGGLPWWSSR